MILAEPPDRTRLNRAQTRILLTPIAAAPRPLRDRSRFGDFAERGELALHPAADAALAGQLHPGDPYQNVAG
jgi:hypothetical protein